MSVFLGLVGMAIAASPVQAGDATRAVNQVGTSSSTSYTRYNYRTRVTDLSDYDDRDYAQVDYGQIYYIDGIPYYNGVPYYSVPSYPSYDYGRDRDVEIDDSVLINPVLVDSEIEDSTLINPVFINPSRYDGHNSNNGNLRPSCTVLSSMRAACQ
jgi:hypothetical protein